MIFADDMRGYYQFPVIMLIEVTDEDVLVGLPAASSHKHRAILLESLNQRQVLRLFLYLQHTVEPGIAANCHFSNSKRCQQVTTLLVLHKEMGETFKYTSILSGIPFEEYLVRAEYRRYAICRNTTML